MVIRGTCRLVPACGDREAVNIAGFVKQLADLCDIVAVAAAVHEVAAADAQGDGIVGADCRAHAFKSLNHETAAVFERAAILVGTVVGQRREELTVQVAGVGFDLDAVKAGLLCDDCGLCLQSTNSLISSTVSSLGISKWVNLPGMGDGATACSP